jgi:predicted AAA+ superfamily ATPase
MSDTGLLCASLDITLENLPYYEKKFFGMVAENYVACALQNKIRLLNRTLFYWKNGSRDESAEVDFLIATDDGNIPIEVKAGVNTGSKSLDIFIEKYDPKYSYRASEKVLAFDPGKKIKSVPLYAVFCIEEMI